MITQAYLKTILTYNPEDGMFKWIKSRSGVKPNLIAGSLNLGYVIIRIDGINYYAHRLAWLYAYGEFPKELLDHINNIRNDNRICNLRECNYIQNQQNIGLKPRNTTGFRGVCFDKIRSKWKSSIRVSKNKIFLGYFDCPVEASKAYEAKAKELHGEFYRKGGSNDS